MIDFFIGGHEPGLIVLAAVVSLISSYACMGLLRHAHRTSGRKRTLWIMISSLAVGFGIWTTHFVAMLAFKPGFEIAYDLKLTAISLLIAIVVCGLGIAMTVRGENRWDHMLGGAVVGVAISAMHYTGMSAALMGGTMQWNSLLVTVSILAGIVFGGIAFVMVMHRSQYSALLGAGLLTLAICGMHFTAMASADFSLCYALEGEGEIHGVLLSILLTFVSFVLVGTALASMFFEDAHARRAQREAEREKRDAARIDEVSKRLELALTHMAQGLALFGTDGRLRLHNQRFVELLQVDTNADLIGLGLHDVCRLTIIGDREVPENIDRIADSFFQQHVDLVRSGGQLEYKVHDERVLSINHSPIGDGSWVTTIDDISERHRTDRAIAHMARHDVLTNLPNRTSFDEQFESIMLQAKSKAAKLAVLAIDLDRFKEINDSHGHAAGDQVLRDLSARLSGALKEDELVARLGGDEFAAVKMFRKLDHLREFIVRVETALNTRVESGSVSLHTGASIGVAIYPDDGEDRSKLLSNADLAMYRAKHELDHHLCYYEREMDEQARQRRDMGRDLWAALDNDDFYLAYQVQKSVSTGEITGYEVLLRWERPEFGLVSPAEFIPIAEECGAISAIGAWVLKSACRDAASWPNDYKIAVNISAIQLGNVDLIDLVREVLDTSGLDPKRLELEVTETAIIHDKTRALHILTQIRAMGVSIAIDDFGTGYSSLDTLRSFPFDKIKLDRSFMSEVENNEQSKAIVRAILALGRSLSVPVLAEGVETLAQLDVLRNEGCNEAQGFLLGRPGTIAFELAPALVVSG